MTKVVSVITVGVLLITQACSSHINCQKILKYHSRNWIDTYCNEHAHVSIGVDNLNGKTVNISNADPIASR